MSVEVKSSTSMVIMPTAIRATPALFHVVPDLGAGVMIYILVSERFLFCTGYCSGNGATKRMT